MHRHDTSFAGPFYVIRHKSSGRRLSQSSKAFKQGFTYTEPTDRMPPRMEIVQVRLTPVDEA